MTRDSLFLCHRLPYPPNKGDKIRSYALLRHLAKRGPVHLACFVDDADDLQYLDKVRELAGGDCYFEPLGKVTKTWRSLIGLVTGTPLTTACFGSSRLQEWVNQTLRRLPPADVVVFGSAMAPYLLRGNSGRVLFDMVDIDSDKWSQYAAGSHGARCAGCTGARRANAPLECEAAAAFGYTFLASDFEADAFRHIAPASASKIGALTNGVELEKIFSADFQKSVRGRRTCDRNDRSHGLPATIRAPWFANEIFPQIAKSLTSARVYFVGSGPPRALRQSPDQRSL